MPPTNRRYDAVICDIDGCLGPESAAPLDADALSQIARYNRLAITRADRPVITVCSGRPQPFAEAMCRFLGNDALPCVAENGVWLFDPRDNTFAMDPAISGAHLEAVHQAMRWIQRDLLPRGVVTQPGKSASISLWHPDTAFLMSLRPTIISRFAEEAWPLRVSATVAWLNCDLEHISKATGLDRLLARTTMAKDRLAGVGDSPSDAAIADHVGFFACPANVHPELRPRAHYVSPHQEVAGVIDILEHLRTQPLRVNTIP